METYGLLSRHTLIWLSMGIFLLLSSAKAEKKPKTPQANVNLSPFRAWRSAYECIINGAEADVCSEREQLTMKGVIHVPKEELQGYCQTDGCGDNIQQVLKCIHQVKRDFWFANKATVNVLQDAISTGCKTSSEINTVDYKSSYAVKMYQSFSKSIVMSAVMLMVFFIM